MSDGYLTPEQAAAYVGAKNVRAFDQWCRRNGVTVRAYYGRHRRFTAAQLDRVLRMMALRRTA